MANNGKRDALGVIFLFAAIILGLIYVIPDKYTGVFGSFLRSVGFGLFGSIAIILPFFLIYASIEFFLEKREGVSPVRFTSVLLLMICVSSLFAALTVDFEYLRELCIPKGKTDPTVLKAVKVLWKTGLNYKALRAPGKTDLILSGGLIGGMISTGIEACCGRIVTVLMIIGFSITQIILIFRISVKRTARKIGYVAKKSVKNVRHNMERKGRPNAYRTDIPQQPRPQYASSSNSPFVMTSGQSQSHAVPAGHREVPIIDGTKPVREDPFNVSYDIPDDHIDPQSGFLNVPNEDVSDSSSIAFGEKRESIDPNAPSADFTFNANEHHLPYVPVKRSKMHSFDENKGKQQDFYSLDEDSRPQIFNDPAEDEYVDSYEDEPYEDDYDEGPFEIDENENDHPSVRTPNVPVGLFGERRDVFHYNETEENGSNVARAINSENSSVPATTPVEDDIKINPEEKHEGFDKEGARIVDTSGVRKGESGIDVPSSSVKRAQRKGPYTPAPVKLLDEEVKTKKIENNEELKAKARQLEAALMSFGIESKVVNITHGPTITRFELTLAPGIKVSRVLNLTNDIQLAMAAQSIRIEAPIPGKSAIGIEIPNDKAIAVRLRSLLETKEFKSSSPLTVALGRDIPGNPMYCDLAKMPHLLIAGSTGSGKSVCLNSILISILCKASPEEVRLIMVDPKVVELKVYNDIPHLIMPVVTEAQLATNTLKWAVIEMEKRYRLFADCSARNIEGYNDYAKMNGDPTLPLILIVMDEFADLMVVASKEVETQVLRLAAKARAAGIHLILATQRPSVDVITGVLKNNLPSRIALAVTSGVDSKTIIDSPGAEKLLGKGDMLYAPVTANKPIRGQGAFVTDAEVEHVTDYLKNRYGPMYDEDIMNKIKNEVAGSDPSVDKGGGSGDSSGEDDLFERAVETIIEANVASVSILQRRLGIGYPRAARLIDEMEQKKYIGPFEGSKPRKVLIDSIEWQQIKASK
ncbi:MAG: DNA translocase FtsK 4TM domain-containing protein [Clostridiales bacterium]|nr:DNA translocase FtsK 4TM domain-containing protein [Clostridiales bacterium]